MGGAAAEHPPRGRSDGTGTTPPVGPCGASRWGTVTETGLGDGDGRESGGDATRPLDSFPLNGRVIARRSWSDAAGCPPEPPDVERPCGQTAPRSGSPVVVEGG